MKEIISFGRIRCPELSPHKNRGMEISYIEKGVLEWMVEGAQETLGPGSVFFTLPWQVHGSPHPREPDNTIWHILFRLDEDYPSPRRHFRFAASLGFSPAEMKSLSAAFAASRRHGFRATPAMRWLMPALIGELQSSHDLRSAQSLSLLRAVLVELKRIVTGEAADGETRSWTEKKVQALLAELSASGDPPWTLARMTGRCGIRRTRLNAVFKKLTGGTPMQYLSRLRIEKAKTLLRETEMRVIDIAFECGFGSSQYFANTFKRAAGMTPGAYRAGCSARTGGDLKKWGAIGFRSEQEEHRRIRTFSTGSLSSK